MLKPAIGVTSALLLALRRRTRTVCPWIYRGSSWKTTRIRRGRNSGSKLSSHQFNTAPLPFDNWTKGDIATASPTRRQSNRQSGCPGPYALQLRCKWRSRPQSGKANQRARLSKRDNVVRTRKPIYLKHLPTAGDSLTYKITRICSVPSKGRPVKIRSGSS